MGGSELAIALVRTREPDAVGALGDLVDSTFRAWAEFTRAYSVSPASRLVLSRSISRARSGQVAAALRRSAHCVCARGCELCPFLGRPKSSRYKHAKSSSRNHSAPYRANNPWNESSPTWSRKSVIRTEQLALRFSPTEHESPPRSIYRTPTASSSPSGYFRPDL